MKTTHWVPRITAGVTTLAVAGVMAVVGATGAAAVVPPYDLPGALNGGSGAYGSLTFYNAAGAVITSGSIDDAQSPKYAVASANPTSIVTNPRAGMTLATPVAGQQPLLWPNFQLGVNVVYPIATAPSPVNTAVFPAGAGPLGGFTIRDATIANPQTSTAALAGVYQIRLKNALIPDFASASISVDLAAGTWTQIFPVPVVPVTNTTTTLAVSPASPATTPVSPTLTATVSPVGAVGSVQFFNGATSLGTSAVAAGVATLALPAAPVGTYSYRAQFIPTDPLVYATSSSANVPYVVNAPVPTPTVALTASSVAPTLGDPVTFTSTVAPAAAAGTVEFFNGATSLGAPVATNAAGGVTFTTSALIAGAHSVTARFVSANAALFNNATSPAVSVNVLTGACAQPGSACTDPQAFTVSVPVGTLVISTPYVPANPFNLGTMTLNASATELSTGQVPFGTNTPATLADGVTITDQRAGDLPWTASLSSTPFTSGANSINARNLGFTSVAPVYVLGNALSAAKPVLPFQNAATTPAVAPSNTVALTGLASPKVFATAAAGNGSVYVHGNFQLNAPTSTPAGTYLGTVTFTIA